MMVACSRGGTLLIHGVVIQQKVSRKGQHRLISILRVEIAPGVLPIWLGTSGSGPNHRLCLTLIPPMPARRMQKLVDGLWSGVAPGTTLGNWGVVRRVKAS